jgi:hypothetical protein
MVCPSVNYRQRTCSHGMRVLSRVKELTRRSTRWIFGMPLTWVNTRAANAVHIAA